MQPTFTTKAFSLASSLNGINRFSMFKLFHNETVLEHIGMVAMFCYLVGQEVNKLSPDYVNMSTLLSKAVVHDIDETATGDLARPTKYYSTTMRQEMARFEAAGVANIANMFAQPAIFELHRTAKEGREGYIVAIADFACAAHRCWEEVLIFGNHALVGPAYNMQALLPKFREQITNEMPNKIATFYADWLIEIEEVLQKVAARAVVSELLELHNAH